MGELARIGVMGIRGSFSEEAAWEYARTNRLGYDAPDLAAWVREMAAAHPGQAVVAVSHGDLIPLYLLRARLLDGPPDFRTGSLFRVEARPNGPVGAVLIDRRELKRQHQQG